MKNKLFSSNREIILQRIQSFIDGGARLGGAKGDSGEDVREILYTSLVVFLHALIDYTRRLYPDFTQGLSKYPPCIYFIYFEVYYFKWGIC